MLGPVLTLVRAGFSFHAVSVTAVAALHVTTPHVTTPHVTTSQRHVSGSPLPRPHSCPHVNKLTSWAVPSVAVVTTRARAVSPSIRVAAALTMTSMSSDTTDAVASEACSDKPAIESSSTLLPSSLRTEPRSWVGSGPAGVESVAASASAPAAIAGGPGTPAPLFRYDGSSMARNSRHDNTTLVAVTLETTGAGMLARRMVSVLRSLHSPASSSSPRTPRTRNPYLVKEPPSLVRWCLPRSAAPLSSGVGRTCAQVETLPAPPAACDLGTR